MSNPSFPGEVSLSPVYRWPTWPFQVSALMNCPAKALAGGTSVNSPNICRGAGLSSLTAPAADVAAGSSSSISIPRAAPWVSRLESCVHICKWSWQSLPLLPLTEVENRGLSAGNAPKTDTDVTAVGHQEPVTFTATVDRKNEKEKRCSMGKDNVSSSNYIKPYKTQYPLRHQRINQPLKADETSLF